MRPEYPESSLLANAFYSICNRKRKCRKTCIFLILSVLLIQPVSAYNSPDASKDISFYASAGTVFPVIAIPLPLKGSIELNLPLSNIPQSFFKRIGLHLELRTSGSILLSGKSIVDIFTVQLKYEFINTSMKLLFTPLIGIPLVLNHVSETAGIGGQIGLVSGWDPFPWLRISSPLVMSVYSDGLTAQCIPGLVFRTPIRLGITVCGNFQVASSSKTDFMLFEKGVLIGIGLDL